MTPLQLSRLAIRNTVNVSHPVRPWIRVQSRSITSTTLLTFPRKNSQDKDSIDTESTEYTRSGTDDQAAGKDTAFDPSTSKPGQEKAKSGHAQNEDPLDVSPANPEVSKGRPAQEGGAQKSAGGEDPNRGKSGQGSPPKGKKVN